MASIQKRGNGWQLRVTHKLLPKKFFHTFETEVEARNYGEQLESLLARGVVPQELLAAPRPQNDLLLTQVLASYAQMSPGVTRFDKELVGFTLFDKPIIGLRLSALTYRWVESYVSWLKSAERNLAPSSIRKRVGMLGRAVDWHIKRTASDQATPMVNVLRLLPRGYSAYTAADNGKVRIDAERDRRLSPEEMARILDALAGKKRDDRERPLSRDHEFAMLFHLIVDTGLRLSEAYKLAVDRIDLHKGIIRLDGSKGHRGQVKPRVVPLTLPLRQVLGPFCKGKEGLLFSYWNGDADTQRKVSSALSRRFATLFDYADVLQFTEHDLRHEAACRWFELRRTDGLWVFSDIEICRIMGWRDTRMALKYVSLRGEDLASRLE